MYRVWMRLQMASGKIPSNPYPVSNVILRWSKTNNINSPLSFSLFPIPQCSNNAVANCFISASPMEFTATTAISALVFV